MTIKYYNLFQLVMSSTCPQSQRSQTSHQHVQPIENKARNKYDNYAEAKKQKKFNYIRRKKQKIKQKRQQSREMLHLIIKDMCQLKASFQQKQEEITTLLQVDLDSDRFFDFINKVIREQMDIFRHKIHSLTSKICSLFKNGESIHSSQIVKLFQLLCIVKQATRQIEKIINCFLIKLDNDEFTNELHRDLDVSTIKIILQSDLFQKQFEQFCQYSILRVKDQRLKKIIQQILNIFDQAKSFVQVFDDEEEDESSLECHQQIQKIESKEERKKNKRKRHKMKQKNKKMEQIINRQIEKTEQVLKYLKQIVINKKQRLNCYVDDSWMQNLKAKYKSSQFNQ